MATNKTWAVKRPWAVTGRTFGQHRFDSLSEAYKFINSLGSSVIVYDSEVSIWNLKDGEWVCYEEVEG